MFLGVIDNPDDGGDGARGDAMRGGEDRGEVNDGGPLRSTLEVGAARVFELGVSKLPDLLLGGVGVCVVGCVAGAA